MYARDSKKSKLFDAVSKPAKDAVVNKSITDYLNVYGPTLNIPALTQKFRDTQTNKHFALWSDGTFHYDRITDNEMSNLTIKECRKGNCLVICAGNACTYEMLLRWRNHKGILNPAWQISMKRN